MDQVRDLRCEYRHSPIAIGTTTPRLSWAVEARGRGWNQSAYQVQVASQSTGGSHADLWDSGKVRSREQFAGYAGRPLGSRSTATWRVRVWNRQGRVSPWSPPAGFEVGLLHAADWHGEWIGDGKPEPASDADRYRDDPAPLLRRAFTLPAAPVRARLHIAGLGLYEAGINGRRVGDSRLDPLWTDYRQRVLVSTYDVTEHLHAGANVIGVTLGNGWWNPLPLRLWGWLNLREHLPVGRPCVMAQLEVECADGSRHTVGTGPGWRWREGPILRNNLYLGETLDRRMLVPGWDTTAAPTDGWNPVAVVPGPVGRLMPLATEPIRIIDRLPARSITRVGEAQIVDFGRNFAGVARLRARGPAGSVITLRFGELLHHDGSLNPMTAVCGQIKGRGVGGPGAPDLACAVDKVILRGEGVEEFTPAFTFRGFRYVEVTGYPGELRADSIEGLAMACDLPVIGSFRSANPLLDRIHRMCLHTFQSNLMGVQSDCPGREKLGYGGDIAATDRALMLNLDMSTFYAKVVHDFHDASLSTGGWMTETAPSAGMADGGFKDRGGHPGSGPMGWGVAHALLVRDLCRYTGNRELARLELDAILRYLDLVVAAAPDLVIDNCIGDHESLAAKDVAVSATAELYHLIALARQVSSAAKRPADTERCRQLWLKARLAFATRFLAGHPGVVGSGSQASQATALALDMVHSHTIRRLAQGELVRAIEAAGGKLTTGIFGTRYLLDALSKAERADLAYGLVNQVDFPGWGYMLKNGATTLWEHWAGSDGTFSHNHPMFGSVDKWLIADLAGLDPILHDYVEIRPCPPPGLAWAAATYRMQQGTVSVHWRRSGKRFILSVEIPPGVGARIQLPGTHRSGVTESGRPAGKSPGVRSDGVYHSRVPYLVGSGSYRFVSTL